MEGEENAFEEKVQTVGQSKFYNGGACVETLEKHDIMKPEDCSEEGICHSTTKLFVMQHLNYNDMSTLFKIYPRT